MQAPGLFIFLCVTFLSEFCFPKIKQETLTSGWLTLSLIVLFFFFNLPQPFPFPLLSLPPPSKPKEDCLLTTEQVHALSQDSQGPLRGCFFPHA